MKGARSTHMHDLQFQTLNSSSRRRMLNSCTLYVRSFPAMCLAAAALTAALHSLMPQWYAVQLLHQFAGLCKLAG